jgi:hypothetical protein
MIGETLFTALIALFWVAEFAFAALVVYWFLTQGFAAGDAATADGRTPLESAAFTRGSLLLWAGFFAALLVLVVVGA